MLLSYLKLSLRLLARNPFFTFINVAGLSVGFAVFFILWQYSQSELRSERQWKDWDRIVRCGFIWKYTDDNVSWFQNQFGCHWPEMTKRVSEDFPEIEEMVRIFRQENFTREHIPQHGRELFLTRINEREERLSFKETSLVYADPNLFNLFSIPMIKGDRTKALSEINSIVLSEKMVKKYFGNQDPINQFLLINNEIALKVTGVYADLPRNSHLDFEAVISTKGIDKYINQSVLTMGGAHTYFRLAHGVNVGQFQNKINDLGDVYWKEKIPVSQKDMTKQEFFLQELKDVPFVNYRWDYFKPKSAFYLNVIAGVSILILFIAWVNYIQLSISFYRKRMKELGIRKANGARISDFARQFLIESFLVNGVSVLLALTLVQLARDPLRLLFDFYVLDWSAMELSTVLIFAFVFVVGVGISGLTPALMASNRDPRSLFNRLKQKGNALSFSNGLVAGQFSIAIVLIVWVFTILFQIDFVLKADLGLNRDHVVLVDLPLSRNTNFDADFAVFMERVKQLEGIGQATFFSSITGDADNNMICLKQSAALNDVCVDTNGGVDENFIPFFQIKLLAGRNFKHDFPSDSSTVILSRRAINRIGISNPEEAIGKKILVNSGTWTNSQFKYSEIIGVVEDYYGGSTSLIKNVGISDGDGGIILTYKENFIPGSRAQKIALQINMERYGEISKSLEQLYKEIFPEQLFSIYFLDEQIGRFYDREKIARNQIILFTVLAIGIACLGLLGMISNKVVEKTKEIGIRKVLGAQLHQIAQLLLNTTFKQIIIASIIGIPVAYYLTQQYLQKFSERIELQWWHFTLPVFILVLIMLATVAYVLWKAAKSNPVEALKYE
jgi:putative ABC transport system permease protein